MNAKKSSIIAGILGLALGTAATAGDVELVVTGTNNGSGWNSKFGFGTPR